MTYEEFIRDVCAAYEQHKICQSSALNASKNMVERALQEHMNPQGKLLDLIAEVERLCEFSAKTPAELFRDRIRALFGEMETPDWISAALVLSGFIAGIVGLVWFLRPKKTNIDPKILAIAIQVAQVYQQKDYMLPEGQQNGKEECRLALMAFEGLLPEEEIQRILTKYFPEGAYHGVRTHASAKTSVLS